MRQAENLKRKKASKKPGQRFLIVCEGEKTEPIYLEDVKRALRLPSAKIEITQCLKGTAPIQIVAYAEKLFVEGDSRRRIPAREWDHVYAVFDRDAHQSYFNALSKITSLHNQRMRNDEKRVVPFTAICSVPNVELWFLLHFHDQLAPLNRDAALKALKKFLPKYEKGMGGVYDATYRSLPLAIRRARRLRDAGYNAYNIGLSSDMGKLLFALRSEYKRMKGKR
ncbi:hypothetical protein MAIT1_01429 [Magnetofaba australis IT-1]|uniref:RloB domain-containing protein n=2 Tax=Magnetofaba TaxID=1472292 RepID=A0A1Y2K0H7_9PROT|nr:hypothetical protein MAIT1_01429 [Magnetofaba australis IT-1]